MNSPLARFIRPLAFVVAALLVVGAVGLFYAGSGGEDDKYRITAYFEKAIGLFENGDVNALGVPIGKVVSVEPQGTRVKVVMEIDEQYKIEKSEQTFAQIVPISVISDRYVQLGPVHQGSGPYLEDGDVLDENFTQIPAELDDVFKQLKKLLDAIEPGKAGDPGALGDLIVQLNRTLKDREQDLQGTLINSSQLTSTLADAEGDISNLLINLDGLFRKLSTRAGSIGELNRNFATVMGALSESRADLEGTLVNLADLTNEVGELARDDGDMLARDLKAATSLTSAVLRHRRSVEESLNWLPVVAEGISAAYHPPPYDDVDVRDNANARLECELLDVLPDGPLKDELERHCRDETGEPRSDDAERTATTIPPTEEDKLNCDKGVRKVKRQLRRVEKINVPDDVLGELLRPLRKNLKKLKKQCDELGQALDDPGDLLDDLPDVPDIDDVEEESDRLSGSAAGGSAVPSAGPGALERMGRWLGGLLSFVGVAR